MTTFKKPVLSILGVLALAAGGTSLVGCDGGTEDAGEAMDEAADDVGDAVEDATD